MIAAAVGILTALLASYLTWRVERRKWLIGLKANVQVELVKTRLASYQHIMHPLSCFPGQNGARSIRKRYKLLCEI